MSKCKDECGFFGNDQYDGYCSSCYKKRNPTLGGVTPQKTGPPPYVSPNPTFSDETEFQTLVKLISGIPEMTSGKIDTVLQTCGVFLTEQQARALLRTIGKESLDGNNFIYHHAIYCRVVDRHNLQSCFGAEGYYYIEPGKKPQDDYKVWDHQHSFLKH